MAAERDDKSRTGTAPTSDFSALGTRGNVSDVAPKRTASEVVARPASGPTLPVWEGPLSRAVRSQQPLQPFSQPPPSSGAPPSLEAPVLAMLQECFAELAGPDSRIDAIDFQRSLAVKDGFLAERVLAVFDRNQDGLVTRVEFLNGIPRLLFGSVRDKLRFAFRLHDLDGNGAVERGEIVRMIELGLVEDSARSDATTVARFTEVLLLAADKNRDGRLSFSEFEALAALHPGVTGLGSRSEQSWIAPGRELPRPGETRAGRWRRALRFLDNNRALVSLLALWALVNILLFVHAWLKYEALGRNQAVMLARGAGACLNFNGALVVLPMARRLTTWIRRTPLVRVLPVDDNHAFHRLLGNTLFALALVHTGAHLVGYSLAPRGIAVSLFGTPAGRSGLALMLVLSVLWIFSRRAVRASGRFELFYRTHLLYPFWFAIALLHGPVFWMWAALPLLLFAGDLLSRWPRRVSRAEVHSAQPLVSGVTKLTIEKPEGFEHTAGDYVFLKLPALARHEWHPFTISSAPEQPLITLHVRSLGDFTTALYQLAQERARQRPPPPLTAYLDGPFGTASARIFASKRAVLIGAGIGVTPFASVLESIVLREHTDHGPLEKVHFYWLNRDAVSFEWFLLLLADLERRDTRRLVDIRIFMTRGRTDSTVTLLSLARGVAHALGDPDLFTGLRAKTEMGAPDWRAELAEASADDPDAVDVFFCGPPGLARSVARACSDLGLRFHQENF